MITRKDILKLANEDLDVLYSRAKDWVKKNDQLRFYNAYQDMWHKIIALLNKVDYEDNRTEEEKRLDDMVNYEETMKRIEDENGVTREDLEKEGWEPDTTQAHAKMSEGDIEWLNQWWDNLIEYENNMSQEEKDIVDKQIEEMYCHSTNNDKKLTIKDVCSVCEFEGDDIDCNENCEYYRMRRGL